MFSNRIANSAKFLQMPVETQLLYFHFVLRADDDGIVEAYPVLKLLGVPPDNFKILLLKGFIQQLNEDQVIVINDWTEHNTIRADRKVNSIYLPLLLEKCPQLPIVMPKPRSDVQNNTKRIGGQSTDGLSQVKLSKVKIRKDKEEGSGDKSPTPLQELIKPLIAQYDKKMVDEFLNYWTQKNAGGKKELWQMQRVFDVPKRLTTWKKKNDQWDKSPKYTSKEEQVAYECVKKFPTNRDRALTEFCYILVHEQGYTVNDADKKACELQSIIQF
jgi:hypothetical protein